MSLLDSYLEYLRGYEYVDESNKEICLDIFKKSLKVTGHIIKTTAVAWGALCSYAARLLSTLGIRAMIIRENIPGKGSDEHKVLALAMLELARKLKEKNLEALSIDLQQIVDKAIHDAAGYVGEISGDMRNNLLSMLKNFLKLYTEIYKKIGFSNNIKIYVELQLLDYETHMWGTPDVIIEDVANKKAIVIDWKTTSESPIQREKYQIYAYAILEALRLGYKPSEIFTAIAPEDIEQTKIYYAIIRPNGIYSDHPFHPISASKRQSSLTIEELRRRLRLVIDIALYMTSLVVDYGTLCCGDNRVNYELREQCKVRLGDGEYFALRLTPPELPRGNPKTQEKSWQCKLCPFSNTVSKLKECEFYFGSKEKDLIDKLMWRYRWIVYGERESALVPYRVLYEVGRKVGGMQNLIKDLREGVWYGVHIKNGEVFLRRYSKMSPHTQPHKRKCSVIEVNFEEIKFNREIRIGLYKIAPLGTESLLLLRDYLPCEAPSREAVTPIYGVRERQPVVVVLPEMHVSSPTLGMVLTAKVEHVLLQGDEIYDYTCPGVCAVVTPISSNLRFPFKLLEKYRQLYGIEEVFVAEVGSDLTHIDLATIHSLHMMLKTQPLEEEGEKIKETVEEAWREVFRALSEVREEAEPRRL